MKYFKLEMQITENEGQEVVTPLISNALDREDAITNFHTSMGSLRASVDQGTLKEATCCVINSWGNVEMPYSEHYTNEGV